jgi:hypothetical protein
MYVPAFSQPIRLFVEAKARNKATDLRVVRNAVGTITDVNEAWMVDYSPNRTRRHYRYSLFSTSGFTSPAQNYALAHQISLVDLSGPEWAELVELTRTSASEFLNPTPSDGSSFPIRLLRQVLRDMLETSLPGTVAPYESTDDVFSVRMRVLASSLVERFRQAVGGALLVFPASVQVQLARPDDLRAFLARADAEPEHKVTLSVARREDDTRARTWVVRRLIDSGSSYTLRLTLPVAIETSLIAESDRRSQVLKAKDGLGGRLDVYWDPRGRDAELLRGPRLFRLIFAAVNDL